MRRRRISAKAERGPIAIAIAVPEGSVRCRRGSAWPAMVRALLERDQVRYDHVDVVMKIAHELLASCDATMTTHTFWVRLAERAGCSTRTVARWLRRFRLAGLLGIVATGRRGCFAKGGHLSHKNVKPPKKNLDTDPRNDAAVYVLCELAPAPEANNDTDSEPVVDLGVMPPPLGVTYAPARACEAGPEAQIEPLRGPDRWKGAQARRRDPVLQHRPGHWFPTGETPGGKDAAWRAANELRVRLPILRCLSSEHVRSVLRPFFQTGYTLGDVLMAIDLRPDGTRWPHDGADSVDNPGAWLAYRLRAWTVDGVPCRSVSQRETHRRAADRARHRADAERTARTIPASDAARDRILAPLRAAGILRPARNR